LESRSEIKSEIESAFDGVTLNGGISLDQTKVIDEFGLIRNVKSKEFDALPLNEVTDDWKAIPSSILDDADCFVHLDAKGFRYYIPALMLRLLENYDRGSMMVISTLRILYPKKESSEYWYSLLTKEQRRAIAHYLKTLPSLVELQGEDRPVVERAFRNYWSKQLN